VSNGLTGFLVLFYSVQGEGEDAQMTMSLYVFSDKQVKSVAEWQAAIDREGYPLQLRPDMIFEQLSGFFPMHLRGELTGFECYHEDLPDVKEDVIPDIDLGHEWKFVLGFVWLGSKWNELVTAWMAATAYAQATDGIIFDGEGGRLYTPAEARALVAHYESPEQLARMQAIRDELRQKE
jgi:hypothetical protein